MSELRDSQAPLLAVRAITKSFPGVKALAGVDFTLRRGEIHALMGENGAGKSTLLKVLTGVHRRDAGEILLNSEPIDPTDPAEAQKLGISTVYQEVNLIPYLSVAENICLGRRRKFGFVRWRQMEQRAQEAVARLGINIDVTLPLASFSIAIQQLVAIARALDCAAKILILDKPTSSLDTNEVRELFIILRQLKTEGLGIIFVTHFLEQVYQISDRITVLRNGQLVGEFETAALPRLQLISHMMGKEMSELDFKAGSERATKPSSEPFLGLSNFGRKGSLQPLDLTLNRGEVLGLAGLLGSGRTELARLVFGIDHADSGEMKVRGERIKGHSPARALKLRFAFCPEDRKVEGLIPNLSVRENILLALQANKGWLKALSQSEQLELVDRLIAALNIRAAHREQQVRLLSGGNQQKVILARWLASQPRLLIMDEPTRGIDVGAKLEIEKLMRKLTVEGMVIIFISSELEEIVRSSDRVVVLRDRQKVGELAGEAISEKRIMNAIAAPADSKTD